MHDRVKFENIIDFKVAIYSFAEVKDGKIVRIFATTRYPSTQKGNLFFDSELVPEMKYSDELPVKHSCMYSVLAFRPSHIFMSRDILGSKPLYYSTSQFSSFRSYIDGECFSVNPGEVLKIDYSGKIIERKIYRFEDVFKKVEMTFEEIEDSLERALLQLRFKNACIAFSGGLDSSLLAAIYDLPLISVTAKKEEEELIRNSANLIGCEVEVIKVSVEDVKWAIEKVRNAVETTEIFQISIGVPIFLTMHLAKNLGYSSIIFGQGADELFGGYKRYENLSYEELESKLVEDLKNIGERNLVRDNKIAYFNEIRLITPYLNWDVIKLALSIPPEMKVFREGEKVVRKYALRKFAENYLPKEIVWREKKAIQYSTGIDKIVKKLVS
ncbi:MAG: asparagine synthetase B [Archaeoglobales archaeon]|nr:asparagine synthetase B [Archaeoglobales archaeon]